MDREQKIQNWLNEDRIALERLAQTQDGQAFLMQILAVTAIFQPNTETDPCKMAFAEGRRSVGIQILELLEAARANSAGLITAKMFRRINNHRIELEGIENGRDRRSTE